MSRIRIIFRWDDISPFQDQGRFRALADLFVKYDVPAVLAVIPENQDETIQFETGNIAAFVDQLRECSRLGWEIAQHGYRHRKQNNDGGILDLNKASEFAGRGRDEQLVDIENGKKILVEYGFTPTTFVPPWHSYDRATLEALAAAGFDALSDGIFLYPRMINDLMHMPVIFWSTPTRLKMLERLGAIYTVCLHPQLVTQEDMSRLERFFKDGGVCFGTVSSFRDEAEVLARPSLRKTAQEWFFARYYRRRG